MEEGVNSKIQTEKAWGSKLSRDERKKKRHKRKKWKRGVYRKQVKKCGSDEEKQIKKAKNLEKLSVKSHWRTSCTHIDFPHVSRVRSVCSVLFYNFFCDCHHSDNIRCDGTVSRASYFYRSRTQHTHFSICLYCVFSSFSLPRSLPFCNFPFFFSLLVSFCLYPFFPFDILLFYLSFIRT